jgi:hypothetical protein
MSNSLLPVGYMLFNYVRVTGQLVITYRIKGHGEVFLGDLSQKKKCNFMHYVEAEGTLPCPQGGPNDPCFEPE